MIPLALLVFGVAVFFFLRRRRIRRDFGEDEHTGELPEEPSAHNEVESKDVRIWQKIEAEGQIYEMSQPIVANGHELQERSKVHELMPNRPVVGRVSTNLRTKTSAPSKFPVPWENSGVQQGGSSPGHSVQDTGSQATTSIAGLQEMEEEMARLQEEQERLQRLQDLKRRKEELRRTINEARNRDT